VQRSYVHRQHLNLLSISMIGNPGDNIPVLRKPDKEPSEPSHPPRTSSLGLQQALSQFPRLGPPPNRPLPHLPKEAEPSAQATKIPKPTGMPGPWAYCPPDQLPRRPGPPPDRPLPHLPKDAKARASCDSDTLPPSEPKIQRTEMAGWI
jgi:hypothetical protein